MELAVGSLKVKFINTHTQKNNKRKAKRIQTLTYDQSIDRENKRQKSKENKCPTHATHQYPPTTFSMDKKQQQQDKM